MIRVIRWSHFLMRKPRLKYCVYSSILVCILSLTMPWWTSWTNQVQMSSLSWIILHVRKCKCNKWYDIVAINILDEWETHDSSAYTSWQWENKHRDDMIQGPTVESCFSWNFVTVMPSDCIITLDSIKQTIMQWTLLACHSENMSFTYHMIKKCQKWYLRLEITAHLRSLLIPCWSQQYPVTVWQRRLIHQCWPWVTKREQGSKATKAREWCKHQQINIEPTSPWKTIVYISNWVHLAASYIGDGCFTAPLPTSIRDRFPPNTALPPPSRKWVFVSAIAVGFSTW